MKELVHLAFEDEVGKEFSIRLEDPVADIDKNKVESAAKAIVESGAFRVKGRLKKLLEAEKIVIDTQTIVSYR